MTILPTFKHIINPKLKNIYLSFSDSGELIVKSPKIPNSDIEKILIKKSLWIEKSRQKILTKKGVYTNLNINTKIYIYGKPHQLTFNNHNKKHPKIEVIDENINIYYSDFDTNKFIYLINNLYKEEAKKQIPNIVKKKALEMNLHPKEIKFRKTKKQWGSCSSKNVLSFNTMIMKLPIDVIEYIVIHELAHIKHKHHKKDFWNLVEKFMPNYKNKIETLKEYST